MARQSKLTPEQWAIAKARWEGCDKLGFQWLAYEIADAWGITILRKSLEQMARKIQRWEKGGDPVPELSAVAVQAPGSPEKPRAQGRSKPIDSANLMSRLRTSRVSLSLKSGVYMLFKGNSLVYIGQSKNVLARVGQHVTEGVKEFDGASFVPCQPELMDALESTLIHLLRPPLNGMAPASKSPIAPLPMIPVAVEAL